MSNVVAPIGTNGSPVKHILTAILDRVRPADKVVSNWRVLSYREDFAVLWGLGTHLGSGIPQSLGDASNLVVVWDGVPSGHRKPLWGDVQEGRQDRASLGEPPDDKAFNVADHLTVYDWLVALSCSLREKEPPPSLRLLVLDLAPCARIGLRPSSIAIFPFSAAMDSVVPSSGKVRAVCTRRGRIVEEARGAGSNRSCTPIQRRVRAWGRVSH